MSKYDPAKIEKKWQKVWESKKLFKAKDVGDKSYVLVEFPYPSGDGLHVGHVRSYTALDIVARKRRMEGKNVLYPMGWDAFGLPAENYAIKTGKDPAITTKKNIENFRNQMKSLGLSFDWSREVNTTDPKYYKWTQWIFLQLLKAGLAYKAKATINWCPKDKIGLANEEVVDGKCERCGTPVEKREKEQWMLAITKYAERLDKDLDSVDYPERVKTQQRNWIGKSEGAEIDFNLDFKKNPKDNERRGPDGKPAHLTVFTTRPDTIFGATYLVLTPEHLWVTLATDAKHDVLLNKDEVIKYIEQTKKKTEIERTSEGKQKTGVELKGVKAINPATKEEMSMWIADYVLPQYGTGAIMAVPAHDERDFEFAKKYELPIKQVVAPVFVDKVNAPKDGAENTVRKGVIILVKHWSEEKYLLNYSPKFNWKCLFTGGIEDGENPLDSAVREIQEETGYQNIKEVRYIHLEHIDKFYAPHKGVNRVCYQKNVFIQLANGEQKEISAEEKDLHHLSWLTKEEMIKTITLPNHTFVFETELLGGQPILNTGILINSGKFNDLESDKAKDEIIKFVDGKKKTTFKLHDWIFSRQRYWGEPIPVIHCEKCGYVPVPEKDLPVKLPKVKKYSYTETGESPLSLVSKWVNVKCPKCGEKAKRETDTMPNWAGSSWYFLRYADPKNSKEFASGKKLKYWQPVDWYNGGMEHTTLHLLYSRFWNKFLYDQKLVPTTEPYAKRTSQGLILAEGGVKMSKSIGNVINPDEIVKTYGADTLRLYEMFIGPFEQAVSWSSDSIIGPRRFLERIFALSEKVKENGTLVHRDVLEKTIEKIGNDIETMGFNTAVSQLMICTNALEKEENLPKKDFARFLQILAPFAPHIAEELWNKIGMKGSIHQSMWPVAEKISASNAVKIAVQINGKVRGTIDASRNDTEETVRNKVESNDQFKKYITGSIKKVIYIPGKIINIVI